MRTFFLLGFVVLLASVSATPFEGEDEFAQLLKEFGNGELEDIEEPSFEESDLEIEKGDDGLGPDFDIHAEKPSLEVEPVDEDTEEKVQPLQALPKIISTSSVQESSKVNEAARNLAKDFWHIDDNEEEEQDESSAQNEIELGQSSVESVPVGKSQNVHEIVSKMLEAAKNAAAKTSADYKAAQEEQVKAATLQEVKSTAYKAAVEDLRSAKTVLLKKQRELQNSAKACSEVSDTAEKKANLLSSLETRLKNLHEILMEEGASQAIANEHLRVAQLVADLDEDEISDVQEDEFEDSTFSQKRAIIQHRINKVRAQASSAAESCSVQVENVRGALSSLQSEYDKLIEPARLARKQAGDAARSLSAVKQKVAVLAQVMAREDNLAKDQNILAESILTNSK